MTATTSRSRGLRRRERPRGRELGRADSKHLKAGLNGATLISDDVLNNMLNPNWIDCLAKI